MISCDYCVETEVTVVHCIPTVDQALADKVNEVIGMGFGRQQNGDFC